MNEITHVEIKEESCKLHFTMYSFGLTPTFLFDSLACKDYLFCMLVSYQKMGGRSEGPRPPFFWYVTTKVFLGFRHGRTLTFFLNAFPHPLISHLNLLWLCWVRLCCCMSYGSSETNWQKLQWYFLPDSVKNKMTNFKSFSLFYLGFPHSKYMDS